MTRFERDRMLAELRWKTRLLMLKYRVSEPHYEPTGRIVNGQYREVRRVA